MITIDTKSVVEEGILYVLFIELEGESLTKVGVTKRSKVEDRVCEILISIWKQYRIFPQCYVKRFRKVKDPFGKEAILLKELEEYRYKTKEKFSGCTEMFKIGPDNIVNTYEQVVKEVLEETDPDKVEKCSVCGKNKKFAVKDGETLRYTCDEDCEHTS